MAESAPIQAGSVGPPKAARRPSRKWKIVGWVTLVTALLVVGFLWWSGRLLGGTAGRVAAIVREIRDEELASSSTVSRLRRFLPGPLGSWMDRLFPRDWRGDYYYENQLVSLGAEAVPVLMRVVEADRSVAARRICAMALGDLHTPAASPLLIRLLRQDGDAEIRAAMAEALAKMRDTNAAPALIESMKLDEARVREASARALGGVRATWAVPEVIGALGSETNRSVMLAMIETLGAFGDSRAMPVLAKHLDLQEPKPGSDESEDSRYQEYNSVSIPEIRSAAAEAVGKLVGDEALTVLVARLERETDTGVTEAICRALGTLRDRRALPALRARMESDEDSKEAVIEALGLIGDPAAVPRLILLLEDGGEDIRYKAVEALGRIGSADSAGRLRPLLEEDPAEAVRAAACTALALLGDVQSQAAILRVLPGLKDGQSEAVWALGHLGDTNCVATLAEYLSAPASMETRFAAAFSLAEIGGSEAASLLSLQLDDKEDYARHGKACALAMLGNDRGLSTVRKGLRAENDWQRFGAAIALIRVDKLDHAAELKPLKADCEWALRDLEKNLLAGSGALALKTLLESKEDTFHNYAARALAFFPDREVLPALRRACSDRDPEVRDAARLSLNRVERSLPAETRQP